MGSTGSRIRPSGLKVLACGVAIAGAALTGAPAGAAKPTVPGQPTNVSAVARVRAVKVTFTKPTSDGGAHINEYRVKCTSSDGGVKRSRDGGHSPIVVDGLSANKTYTCTVAAHNKVGFGPASAPSNSVVTLPMPPGAPTNVTATPGKRSVKVTFTKPASNGGSKITEYRAKCTSSDGGVTRSHNGAHSPIVVDGLTAKKTYTCTVAAHNEVGFGPASAPSNPVVTL